MFSCTSWEAATAAAAVAAAAEAVGGCAGKEFNKGPAWDVTLGSLSSLEQRLLSSLGNWEFEVHADVAVSGLDWVDWCGNFISCEEAPAPGYGQAPKSTNYVLRAKRVYSLNVTFDDFVKRRVVKSFAQEMGLQGIGG